MAIQLNNAEAGPSTDPRFNLAYTLRGHSRAVTALRFTPDAKMIVSAGADGYVHFWDTATGAHRRSIRCHRSGINDISLSPDGLYLATASDDGTSQIFAVDPLVTKRAAAVEAHRHSHPAPLRTLAAHTAPVLSVAFSPKSNLLVTGSYDESAIVWDVRRGKPLKSLPAHSEAIWTVGWDSEGALVLTGGMDGLIRLWDVNAGQCLKTFDNESNSPVSFASFTPSTHFILSSTLSSTIRVYSLHTGKVLKTLRAPDYVSESFPSPAYVFAAYQSKGHKRAVANGLGGHSQANGVKNEDAMDIDGRNHRPEPASSSATATPWVVAGSESGTVVVWDLQERKVLQVLSHAGAITSEDNAEGAAPLGNGAEIKTEDTTSVQEAASVPPTTTPGAVSSKPQVTPSPVVALAVSRDGSMIASGTLEPDRSIKVWRIHESGA